MDMNHAMTVIKKSKVFHELDDSLLDTLMFLSYTKQFSEGETIYTKDEPSNDRFCLIVSGSVNIITKDESVFKVVGSGEVIGEIALSDPNHRRTVTVAAAEPTEILEWDVNHVKEKIPGIWKKLVKLAWEHIREFYQE
jgi:CRP-like cAMP-binding protein